MKLIKEICNEPQVKCDNCELRRAARALVFNDKNEIALMNVTKHNYYKLPGGGIEHGEDIQTALAREIKEEVGATIHVVGELGMIIETRSYAKFRGSNGEACPLCQISYCYIAKVISLGENCLDEEETSDGFTVEWHPLDKAIQLLKDSEPRGSEYIDYSGKYIVERDLAFLNEYKKAHPKIITICGSLRFQDQQMITAERLELEGNAVISCIYPPPNFDKDSYIKEQGDMLDKMHKAKIDISDAIFVVNVGGYVGTSTKSEIEYAKKTGKEVMWLEPS